MTQERETTNETTHPLQIVVGIDGSPASMEALDWGASQATLTGSLLEIVMTWEWPQSYGWNALARIPADFSPEQSTEKILERAADDVRAKYPDIEITTRVVEGHPAPALIEASKGARLLVVGSRGHGEFVGMLLGSVSEYCATHAHCPVVVHRVVD